LDEDFLITLKNTDVLYDKDMGKRRLDGHGDVPIAIGTQAVTREEIECFDDDEIKLIFEFGKRQEIAGAETCFDHTPYIVDGREDSIPYTSMADCNKANTDRRRCFLYAYQISMNIGGPRIIMPTLFTKITFKSMSDGITILPGD
jgi:hypothetical protein